MSNKSILAVKFIWRTIKGNAKFICLLFHVKFKITYRAAMNILLSEKIHYFGKPVGISKDGIK